MNPKISVIVPNYNHAPFLKERIDSILNQTYQDFELILLDDCSTDSSRVVLDEYRNNPKVASIVYNIKNSGSPFAQWRKGVEMAKGEWIWIAESDDVADINFLQKIIDAKNTYPSVGLVYTHLQWIDAHGKFMYSEEDTGDVLFYTGEEFVRKKLLYTTTIFNVSSALFRRDLSLSVDWSLFEKMRMNGDYYFYTLLSEKTDVLEVCEVLDKYRQHGKNTSGKELNPNGYGLIEGMPILNRIVDRYRIPQSAYAMHYAQLWVHAEYRRSVDIQIAKVFAQSGHWLVIVCFIAINIKRSIVK